MPAPMHVIVTGGSSGIGLELARHYLRAGARVSLLSRRMALLETARRDLATSSGRTVDTILIEAVDVADDAAVSAAVSRCETAFGPCDLLIASAGVVEPQAFDDMSSATFDRQIATNLTGSANAVRAVYSSMKRRRSGHILLVSSGAALIGIHGYTAYCASKSALRGFAEALREEVREAGIHISICFPPDTLTPQYLAELPRRSPQAVALMGTLKPWDATAVAALVVKGIARRRFEIHFGPALTALALFGPLVKPVLLWWTTRKR